VLYLVTSGSAAAIYSRTENGNPRDGNMVFVSGAEAITGRLVGQTIDMPKRWKMLRFSVSTASTTTVTVTGTTENPAAGAVIYQGAVNAENGQIIDAHIPREIARSRWIELKFEFGGSEWARIDGFSLYGEYLPPRVNKANAV